MHQRTLLIIGNDGQWLRTTADVFRQRNYNVVSIFTLAESLETARRFRPDCVLVDSCVEEMEGSELVAWIRADAKLWDMPIVLAGGDVSKDLTTDHDAKFDVYFLKDWPSATVFAIVENLMRRIDWERGGITHNDVRLDGASFWVFRNSKAVSKLSREQFCFLHLLIAKTPGFVSEATIAGYVFESDNEANRKAAIRGLAQRLRINLGTQLSRRIQSKVLMGWRYLAPRARRNRKTILPARLALSPK